MVLAIYQSLFAPKPQPASPGQDGSPVAAVAGEDTSDSMPALVPFQTGEQKENSDSDGDIASAAAVTNSESEAVTGPTSVPKETLPTNSEWSNEDWVLALHRERGIERLGFPKHTVAADDPTKVDFLGGGLMQFWAGKPNKDGAYFIDDTRVRSTLGTVGVSLEAGDDHKFILRPDDVSRRAEVRVRKIYGAGPGGLIRGAYDTNGLVYRIGNKIERVDQIGRAHV